MWSDSSLQALRSAGSVDWVDAFTGDALRATSMVAIR